MAAETQDTEETRKNKKTHFPDTIKNYWATPEELVIIGLDTKHTEEDKHPLFDSRVDLPIREQFVEYMMMPNIGFDSVITVRKNGEAYEVVKGRQRVKTAREANKRLKKLGRPTLRCKVEVTRGDEDETLLDKKFGENAHKQADKPMEVARNIRDYMTSGRTEEEAAVVFNTTVANVRMLRNLLDLDKSIQNAVDKGRVAATAVAPLAQLSREDQRAEFIKLEEGVARGQKVTHKTAKAVAKAKKKGDDEVIVPPAKRLVTKMLKLDDESNKNDRVMSADFRRAVEWMLGDVGSSRIRGMLDLERRAQAKPEKE